MDDEEPIFVAARVVRVVRAHRLQTDGAGLVRNSTGRCLDLVSRSPRAHARQRAGSQSRRRFFHLVALVQRFSISLCDSGDAGSNPVRHPIFEDDLVRPFSNNRIVR